MLHRDISVGNLLIVPNRNDAVRATRGVLIDLDHSKKANEKITYVTPEADPLGVEFFRKAAVRRGVELSEATATALMHRLQVGDDSFRVGPAIRFFMAEMIPELGLYPLDSSVVLNNVPAQIVSQVRLAPKFQRYLALT